jgi:uncharacterized membrane protein YuzA (DUF378 family)
MNFSGREQTLYVSIYKGVDHLNKLALILVIIGALNWGCIGIFGFDVIGWLFGGQLSAVSRVVFTIVGLAGIWCISLLFRRIEFADKEV